MYCNTIVANWKEGLISTGEAIAQILTNEHDSINGKHCALADIAVTLQEQEQEQAEAEAADAEYQHWLSEQKHGPHGKRCICDECTGFEDISSESEVLEEEQSLALRGYQNSHVLEFIKHYGF